MTTRLSITLEALKVTTLAVKMKERLLKEQLRRAVARRVHVKQYEESEARLPDAVADKIIEVARS